MILVLGVFIPVGRLAMGIFYPDKESYNNLERLEGEINDMLKELKASKEKQASRQVTLPFYLKEGYALVAYNKEAKESSVVALPSKCQGQECVCISDGKDIQKAHKCIRFSDITLITQWEILNHKQSKTTTFSVKLDKEELEDEKFKYSLSFSVPDSTSP